MTGTLGDDLLFGLEGNDFLDGRRGNDVFRPGTGSDRMDGGAGDDIAIFADVSYLGPDTFDGGRGRDTVDLSGIPVSSGWTYWEHDPETGVYSVNQFADPLNAPSGLTFTNVETLIGSRGDDLMSFVWSSDNLTIDTGLGDDWIRLGTGNATVRAGAGDDIIDFASGRIDLAGNTGNDTIRVGSATGGKANGGNGIDTIATYGNVDLQAGWAMTGSGVKIVITQFENISINGGNDGTVARGDDNDNVLDGGYWPSDFLFYGRGGNDTITGGDGADQLFGDAGDDILEGGYGADTLTGGTGADVFRFTDDFFSRAPVTDTITDFQGGRGDRIDVSGIDADPSTPQQDVFRLINADAFSGRAGQLRYEIRGNETFVQIDTNGDAAADFEIRLLGAHTLVRNDFILVPEAIG